MAKNIEHISHIKSNSLTNGMPSLPTSGAIIYGEIAINFKKGVETIALRNDEDEIVTFSSDNRYTELKLGSGFTGANSAKTVSQVISEDEEVIASALNDLNMRIEEVAELGDLEYVSQGEYDSNTKRILLKNKSGDTLVNIDATDFIKDGMVSNVELTGTNLVITFNTDAGQEPITIDLTQFFDPSNYYTKVDIDNKMGSALTGENSAVTVTDLFDELSEIVGTGFPESSITEVIADNEFIVSSALNDLNDRIDSLNSLVGSGFTGANITKVIEDDETAIAAALNDLNNRIGEIDLDEIRDYVDNLVGSGFTGTTITQTIIDDEYTIAIALNDLDQRISGLSEDLSDLSGDISNVEDDLKAYVDGKLGTAFTGENSAVTVTDVVGEGFSGQTLTEVVHEMDRVIAESLNDLDQRISGLSDDIGDVYEYVNDRLGDAFTGANSSLTVTDYVENALGEIDVDAIISTRLGENFSGANSSTTVSEYVDEVEFVMSTAMNDLNSRVRDNTSDIEAIEGSIADLEREDSALYGEIASLESSLSNLSGSMDDVSDIVGSGFPNTTITQVIRDDEEAIAEALNDLDERVSGATRSVDGVIASMQSFEDQVDSDIQELEDDLQGQIDEINGKIGSGFSIAQNITYVIEENEFIIANALADIDERVSANTQAVSDVPGLIDDRLGSAFTGVNSSVTVTEVIEENEMAYAASVNDLNSRVTTLEGSIGGLPIAGASGPSVQASPNILTNVSSISAALTITLGTDGLNALRSNVYDIFVPVASSYASPSITLSAPSGYNIVGLTGGTVPATAGKTTEIYITCVGANMYVRTTQY